MSRRSEAIGRNGEELVDKLFHAAARAGRVADIRKIATPTKRGEDGQIIYVRKSTTDFYGHLLDGSGRAVYEEIKTTEGEDFSLSVIPSHQKGALDRGVDACCVAVLTVVHLRSQTVSVCPWIDVRDAKTLRPDFLARYRVAPGDYLRRFLRPVCT